VTGYGPDGRGCDFSVPPRPNQYWGTPSRLSNRYRGYTLGDWGRSLKLSIPVHVVRRLRRAWSFAYTPSLLERYC